MAEKRSKSILLRLCLLFTVSLMYHSYLCVNCVFLFNTVVHLLLSSVMESKNAVCMCTGLVLKQILSYDHLQVGCFYTFVHERFAFKDV